MILLSAGEWSKGVLRIIFFERLYAAFTSSGKVIIGP